MRRLFNVCKLIHSDLSEFNILYNEGKLVIIDVSQSVESDHPMALEFLIKDCVNINEFFRKKSVPTMTARELFNFITDPNIDDTNINEYLEKAQQIAAERTLQQLSEKEIIEEEVFKNSYIPQRLDHVIDHEKDITKVQRGEKEILYGTITGLKSDLSGPSLKPALFEDTNERIASDDNDDDDDSTESFDSIEETKITNFKNSGRPKDESVEEKKQRKQLVKEMKREKRVNKMPKHVKKRKEKLSQNSKKK